jgi:hypothetical protein
MTYTITIKELLNRQILGRSSHINESSSLQKREV